MGILGFVQVAGYDIICSSADDLKGENMNEFVLNSINVFFENEISNKTIFTNDKLLVLLDDGIIAKIFVK